MEDIKKTSLEDTKTLIVDPVAIEEAKKKKEKKISMGRAILIFFTVISVLAAICAGALLYAATNVIDELTLEKNALNEKCSEYSTRLVACEDRILELEAEVLLKNELLAGNGEETGAEGDENVTEGEVSSDVNVEDGTVVEENDGSEEVKPEDGSGEDVVYVAPADVVDFSTVTNLDKKPDTIYEEGVKYTVSINALNMRTGPATQYKAIGSVQRDDVVTAYGESGDWLCVKNANGLMGWINRHFVDETA